MKIEPNGNISGVESWRIITPSGAKYIVYKKNGSWYRGDIGHMGNKYDKWSLNELANFLK